MNILNSDCLLDESVDLSADASRLASSDATYYPAVPASLSRSAPRSMAEPSQDAAVRSMSW